MDKNNDNRMGWIRNIENLSKKNKHYLVEYEIGSECRIPGLFAYMNDGISCKFFTLGKDKYGLYHYILKIQYPELEPPYYNKNADESGYYFKGGVLGEILSLFSLFLRCRFYLISAISRDVKTEYSFIYKSCDPEIHPQIFGNNRRNFAMGLNGLLDSIKKLDEKYHQRFILACHHYLKALREVGIDHDMVFVKLVSAIEALSKFTELNTKDDVLKDKGISDFIDRCSLSKEEKMELKIIFDNRKSKRRFIRFIEEYSKGFFKGGRFKAPQLKIKKSDLPKTLSIIYDARSGYLHNGEPMYLSQPMRGGQKWDIDPAIGAIIDNRRISERKKVPYTYWFEGLVRHCLLKFLEANLQE